jgi:hypothetical protein
MSRHRSPMAGVFSVISSLTYFDFFFERDFAFFAALARAKTFAITFRSVLESFIGSDNMIHL